jgi:nitroimidazol reductase NimA-like FMN-containing flavoprotein (pyridoxamine 5'-phosphate oxidase superfamily)
MECLQSRNMEKDIISKDDIFDIIRSQKLLTIAMCVDNEPYLATLDYGFEGAIPCFYFQVSKTGRKNEILRKNPYVFGQIHEDRGYVQGACDHAFRMVQFKGKVAFLSDPDEIALGISRMMDHLESNPAGMKDRILSKGYLDSTIIGRIDILEMSGKINEPRDRTGEVG